MARIEEKLSDEDLRRVYKRIMKIFAGSALFFLLVGGIVVIVGWAIENTQLSHSGWGIVALGFCLFLLALIVWLAWKGSRIELM